MNNIKPIIFGLLGASLVANVMLAIEYSKQKKVSAFLMSKWIPTDEEEKEDE